MSRLETLVFRLFERRRLRDWFYTAAFLIFVPVGYRFAALAWRYGSWFDKPLAVIAGLLIGITAIVTLLRFWMVAPQQVTAAAPPPQKPAANPRPAPSVADELLAARLRRAAENRALASSAGALGSTLK